MSTVGVKGLAVRCNLPSLHCRGWWGDEIQKKTVLTTDHTELVQSLVRQSDDDCEQRTCWVMLHSRLTITTLHIHRPVPDTQTIGHLSTDSSLLTLQACTSSTVYFYYCVCKQIQPLAAIQISHLSITVVTDSFLCTNRYLFAVMLSWIKFVPVHCSRTQCNAHISMALFLYLYLYFSMHCVCKLIQPMVATVTVTEWPKLNHGNISSSPKFSLASMLFTQ